MSWLEHAIAVLNTVLFTVGNEPVSWASLFGFVTSLATVGLAVRLRVGNFAFGLVNAVFFTITAAVLHTGVDAYFQGAFVLLTLAGWWLWLHGGPGRSALPVTWASSRLMAGCVSFVVVATVGFTVLFTAVGYHRPLYVAVISAITLPAQYLLNLKKVQAWAFWLISDIGYLPLLYLDGLQMTAIVYIISGVLSAAGFWFWLGRLRSERQAAPVLAGVER